MRRGEGWLPEHPERALITRRYLKHEWRLVNPALAALGERTPPTTTTRRTALERPVSLKDQRLGTVQAVLKAVGRRSVLDLGCGAGALLERLAKDGYTRLTGADVSARAPRDRRATAARRTATCTLLHSPLTYRDKRLARLRRGRAGRGDRALRPAAPARGRAERVRLRAAQDGRRDHAERRVQPAVAEPADGLPARRPPLRVDARGVRRLGDARQRHVRLHARASCRSAPRTPRPAHPRRWRCSSDEDRAGRALPRRADRRLRLRQEHVRGPALPAHGDDQLATSAARSWPTTPTTRTRPRTRSRSCTRSPSGGSRAAA